MTDLSVIAGGWRLRCGGVVGGGSSGEVAVNGGGCDGVHQRWLKETILRPFFYLTLNISSFLLILSSDNIHHFRRPYHRRLCSNDLPPPSPMSTAPPPPPPSPSPTSVTAINHHLLLRSLVNIHIYIRSY
ncbi:unnamed protein product [Lactuca saligna]|uniref:Uncharacterized protein n=1 Tax=Lactuca saligna TaxID=75948 RepID=A0AA35Y9T7_LACSI|nr:unnamed protein product [Lactuca saligna]